MNEGLINPRDMPLLIDDECNLCGKLVARSNMKHISYMSVCGNCYETVKRCIMPEEKPKEIKALLKTLAGRDHDECIRNGICTFCGGEAKTFRNAISRRENQISGFCQQCQDRTFGKD